MRGAARGRFALERTSGDSFSMTITPDEVRFSRCGARYLMRLRAPLAQQQTIRAALQEARTWADLPPDIYALMEEAGFGPDWHM